MEQMNNTIKVALGAGTEFKIIFAGEMVGDDGQPIAWGDSIKIVQGRNSIKLTAMEAARLFHAMQQPDIKAVLQERFKAEKQALQDVEGF